MGWWFVQKQNFGVRSVTLAGLIQLFTVKIFEIIVPSCGYHINKESFNLRFASLCTFLPLNCQDFLQRLHHAANRRRAPRTIDQCGNMDHFGLHDFVCFL